MSAQLYPKGKAHILGLSTKADLIADNMKIALIDTDTETYNSNDEFLSDITGGGIVATSGNLSSKTVTDGVFKASDITITSVTGATIEAAILYKDTGTAGTSPLIAWFDIETINPNGSDRVVAFNPSGIFAI